MKEMYSYHPSALPSFHVQTLKNFLQTQVPWRRIVYYSNKRKSYVNNPRATWVCGFHEPYLYSFENINPNPFPKNLQPLIKWVQDFTECKYNFLLFSKYETGLDSITWHADDEKFITPGTAITSLTILEDDADSRVFYLKNLKTKEKHSWNLSTGDLFKMNYECQDNYHHAILKEPNTKGVRYSVTFRNGKNKQATKNYYTYN